MAHKDKGHRSEQRAHDESRHTRHSTVSHLSELCCLGAHTHQPPTEALSRASDRRSTQLPKETNFEDQVLKRAAQNMGRGPRSPSRVSNTQGDDVSGFSSRDLDVLKSTSIAQTVMPEHSASAVATRKAWPQVASQPTAGSGYGQQYGQAAWTSAQNPYSGNQYYNHPAAMPQGMPWPSTYQGSPFPQPLPTLLPATNPFPTGGSTLPMRCECGGKENPFCGWCNPPRYGTSFVSPPSGPPPHSYYSRKSHQRERALHV
jgi:hypothetical protein